VDDIRLVRPDSPAAWAAARRLVLQYAASLDIDLGFQDFGREIESLAAMYGPPDGVFLLAEHVGAFVGCGAFHRFAGSICELKRLYVIPAMLGRGIGRALTQALIDEARHHGYEAIALDTLPSMKSALALYTSLGFRPTPPYRYNPVPGAIFLSLPLRQSDSLRT
jgi:GNAT superfamily N-acetyltransferase